MNILIDLTHPAHVHFFKYAAMAWMKHGHLVKFVARDKEITFKLMKDYGLEYKKLSSKRKGLFGLAFELVEHQSKLFSVINEFNPDVIMNIGGTFIVHVAKLLRKNTCVFTDTEHAKFSNNITFPFATWICTPNSYLDDLGEKQVRYNGYQELAYLHPNYFKPNKEILEELNLDGNEHFFVLRFISWGASHDVGQTGLSDNEKIALTDRLKEYGRIFITSEGELPDELKPYELTISPTEIHDLLYYTSMYIGEGATMASEAAILGTPSVYINPLTSGNIEEIKHKYHLMYHFPDKLGVIDRIIELAANKDLKKEHQLRRQKMLEDKIDVTAWVVDLVESLEKRAL